MFSMACGGAILKQAHFIFTEWYAIAITYMCVGMCVFMCMCVFFFLSVVRNRLEMLHCSTESFLLGPQGVWPTPRNQNYRGEDFDRGGGRECRTSAFEKYNLAPSNISNSWKTQSDSAENRPPSSQVRESLDSRTNKTNLCVTVCSLCLLRGHFAGRGHDSLPLCLAGLGEPNTVQSWKPTRPPTVTQSWGSWTNSQILRSLLLSGQLVLKPLDSVDTQTCHWSRPNELRQWKRRTNINGRSMFKKHSVNLVSQLQVNTCPQSRLVQWSRCWDHSEKM